MSNCATRIVANNLMMGATITVNPVVNPYYPAGNLQMLWRSRYMQTNTVTSQQILFNLSASAEIDALWIPVDTDWTVVLELFDGQNQTGTKVATQQLTAGKMLCLADFCVGTNCWGDYEFWYDSYRPEYFTPVTARSGRITLTADVAASAVIPWIVLGKSWQPEYGADIGAVLAMRSTGETARTRGGTLLPIGLQNRWRELTFDLSSLSAAERVSLWTDLVGNNLGVMVDMIPADITDLRGHHAFLANLTPPAFTHNGNFHAVNPQFVEI